MSARDTLAEAEIRIIRNGEFEMNTVGSYNADLILAALSSAGFVVVPREPTEQMLYVAHRDAEIGPTNAREAWSAMLSAK